MLVGSTQTRCCLPSDQISRIISIGIGYVCAEMLDNCLKGDRCGLIKTSLRGRGCLLESRQHPTFNKLCLSAPSWLTCVNSRRFSPSVGKTSHGSPAQSTARDCTTTAVCPSKVRTRLCALPSIAEDFSHRCKLNRRPPTCAIRCRWRWSCLPAPPKM